MSSSEVAARPYRRSLTESELDIRREESVLEKPLTVSVIVVTMNRPDCVRRCLECLFAQTPQPDQVLVVDASPDDRTRRVVEAFPGVVYLRNEQGYGHMTMSRNIGLKASFGEIIAFIDDDAYAHPGWLAALYDSYRDPAVGAVGGRALNNVPGEATQGVDEIGRLKPNGVLTGNFAADPGKTLDVDHLVGCNMSFRRQVLATLGGLRDDYPGTEVREETDICLRVKRLGHRILFNPAACVDHLPAPQAKGKRFDARYGYYVARNHLALLIRNYGLFAPIVWRYLLYGALEATGELGKKIGAALARFGAFMGGMCVGLGAGIKLLKRGCDPVRRDAEGREIAALLQQTPIGRTQGSEESRAVQAPGRGE